MDFSEYKPLDEEYIKKHPQLKETLTRMLERERNKFKPEPNTFNWMVEHQPELFQKKNRGCYTSTGFEHTEHRYNNGMLDYIESYKRMVKEIDKHGNRKY